MKKEALGVIITVVMITTALGAGCTAPTTQNNTIISNASKKSNYSARLPTRNNITIQFYNLASNASKKLNSTGHEVRVVTHFLNGLIQLVTDTTRDLHGSASSKSISLMTLLPLQRVNLFFMKNDNNGYTTEAFPA